MGAGRCARRVRQGLILTERVRYELARTETSTAVLVLTTYDADIFDAIDAGAAGYVLKDTPADRLFEAIRSVRKGALTCIYVARS